MPITYILTFNFVKDMAWLIAGGISFFIIYSLLKLIFTTLKEITRNQNDITQALNNSFDADIPDVPEGQGGTVEFLSDMTEEEYEEESQPKWYKKLYDNK